MCCVAGRGKALSASREHKATAHRRHRPSFIWVSQELSSATAASSDALKQGQSDPGTQFPHEVVDFKHRFFRTFSMYFCFIQDMAIF